MPRKKPKPAYTTFVIPLLKGPGQRIFFKGWVGITIWSYIFSWRPLDEVELAHELEHVRQWRENGLLYIPRYMASSAAAAKAGKDRYMDNEFEVKARAAGEKARHND